MWNEIVGGSFPCLEAFVRVTPAQNFDPEYGKQSKADFVEMPPLKS